MTVTFDPAPLLAQAELATPPRPGRFGTYGDPTTASFEPHPRPCGLDMAATLGVGRQTLARWASGQRLRRREADRCACALGLHPVSLWDDWYSG